MTDAELQRLERLEKAATPGPWTATSHIGGFGFSGPLTFYSVTNEYSGKDSPIWLESEDNVRFIAAARNALPELIAEIRRLRAERQTGIGRATWSAGDEEEGLPPLINQDARFFLNDAIDRICTEEGKRILHTDSRPLVGPHRSPPAPPIKVHNDVLESTTLPLEILALPANGPVIMSLDITETNGASNQ